MKIMTYNIRHGLGMDGTIDLKRIANVVLREKPDLVAVQEVDRNTTRSGQCDQAEVLSDLCRMNYCFSESIPYEGGQYGNMLMTPHPISEYSSIALPGREARSALKATVEVNATVLDIIATHLDLVRDKQWESIPLLNQLALPCEHPTFLAGDFNTNPQSATIRMLLNQWSQAGAERVLFSYPTSGAIEQIDYIFGCTPRGHLDFVETRLIKETVASDHFPLITEVILA